jgi:hypothetical protein
MGICDENRGKKGGSETSKSEDSESENSEGDTEERKHEKVGATLRCVFLGPSLALARWRWGDVRRSCV